MLRSDAQGRIPVDPDARDSLSDLVEWSATSMPTVQREIDWAENAGIVATEKVGPTRLVRANPSHPLYGASRQLILATYGPPAIIGEEFTDIDGAEGVLLFGSWAARYQGEPGRASNDIDVLVVGNPDRDDGDDAAERAERRIGLPVQATVRTRKQRESTSESFSRISARDRWSSSSNPTRPIDELGARPHRHRATPHRRRARTGHTLQAGRRTAPRRRACACALGGEEHRRPPRRRPPARLRRRPEEQLDP